MNYFDFEYDGISLSNMGYILCNFDSGGGVQSITNGSQINFNTTPTRYRSKDELLSTEYSECLTTKFQICKNVCQSQDDLEISIGELRELMKWLNRKGFYKFKILDSEFMNIYFEASFNISRIEIGNKIYGLELDMITNRPFALHEPEIIYINNSQINGKQEIGSLSDEEGYIYPHMEITIKENGNLSIYNALEDRTMYIANCTYGETITLDYPIIQSSLQSHNIQNDFNWKFFRIANTYKNKINEIDISLPCEI